jgi:ribonuclease HI
MIYEDALNIYTDGSSLQKPRRGGIGIRFIWIDDSGNEAEKDVIPTGYKSATNNQMEIQACIIALREALGMQILKKVSRIVIFTDSQYVKDNYQRAMFAWPKSQWRGVCGRPILNADQWKELTKYIKKVGKRVDFEKVKAHSNDKHNKAVDKIANISAKAPLNNPLTNVRVRRKITTESVEVGCVKMLGQRISIRIISGEKLKVQKIYKYKYEIVSKNNPFSKKVDIAFSGHMLREGHSYSVRFNIDTNNPRIEKVFREIGRRVNNVRSQI